MTSSFDRSRLLADFHNCAVVSPGGIITAAQAIPLAPPLKLRLRNMQVHCDVFTPVNYGQFHGVKINDEVGHFFITHKNDLLSPILFNIVVNMLAILLSKAKANNQFVGVVSASSGGETFYAPICG